MGTFIGWIIGLGVIGLLLFSFYAQLLPIAAVVRYRWNRGGEHRRSVQRGLWIGGGFLLFATFWESTDLSTGALVFFGVVAGGVALVAWLREPDQVAEEQARIDRPVTVPVASVAAEERVALCRDTVPVWRNRGKLDFRIERNDAGDGSVVVVHGPVGWVGVATVSIRNLGDEPHAVWDYDRWEANDRGSSPFALVLTDARDQWVKNVRHKVGV